MDDKDIRLYVGGCHFFYHVFFNGHLVGKCYDGYFPKELTLNPYLHMDSNLREIKEYSSQICCSAHAKNIKFPGFGL